MTRRKLLKKGIKLFVSFLGMFSVPAVYSVWGERFWFEVKKISLSFPDLPPMFDGLKIIQFSDLHVDHFFDAEHLQTLVDLIQLQNADLICFTGDLIDQEGSGLAASISTLSQLQAPLGKWAVVGNHDYWTDVLEVKQVLAQSGFQLLQNQSHVFVRDGQRLALAGVDDALNGSPDIKGALEGIDPHTFTILLSHVPDYALVTKEYPVRLQLSGHSHGGQVRLPWLGHVLTPPGAKHFVEGLIHVPDSLLQLYVNRGVGTTGIPIRFLCRPEITVFTLKNKPFNRG